jgi:AraC-like DNA-binding protein
MPVQLNQIYVKTLNTVSRRELELPLWLRREPRNTDMPFHGHDFVELVIVTKGKGLHHSHYSTNELLTGSVIAIPRGGIHSYSNTDDLGVENILFDPNKLPMPRLDLYSLPGFNALFMLKEEFFSSKSPYPSFTLNSRQLEKVKWLIAEMSRECESTLPGRKFCLLAIFMVMLGFLSQWYGNSCKKMNDLTMQMGKVISHLNINYASNVNIEKLTSLASMSKSTLRRNFIRATGTTPINYLLKLRIDHACIYLREENIPIFEVALKVGFSDSNYFSRIFKKFTGTTPGSFRKKNFYSKGV